MDRITGGGGGEEELKDTLHAACEVAGATAGKRALAALQEHTNLQLAVLEGA